VLDDGQRQHRGHQRGADGALAVLRGVDGARHHHRQHRLAPSTATGSSRIHRRRRKKLSR
jgi:hypothetical protein